MNLSFGFTFRELYDNAALQRLDARFLETLPSEIATATQEARNNPDVIDRLQESRLLISIAPYLEDFIAKLFGIEKEAQALTKEHTQLEPLFRARRDFVKEPSLIADNQPTGASLKQSLGESYYCIICHNQGKDSCSAGLRDRKTGEIQTGATGSKLYGCPLDEKISEMHQLRRHGRIIGALAVVMVDNPLCAVTGHRICNDCMKSCIYQKQPPVNTPQAESRTLKDVLHLPWGFEIYSLLSRWNPLNLRQPYPKEASGRKVLVVGLGPAGFALSHYLLNDGHEVVAVDGLKIEPLDKNLVPKISTHDASLRAKRSNPATEVGSFGRWIASLLLQLRLRLLPQRLAMTPHLGTQSPTSETGFAPIKDIASLFESAAERTIGGFGGVMEYGITARWDKNYLKIIRLLLERRRAFSMFGGTRFGSNIDINWAFENGFDHIALCLGAGKPTMIEMKNKLANGVRMASDFLMALQLTGAAKASSIANLDVRLPVAVIGGGLTAVDAATEALAYYPIQVEKFLSRYEKLAAEHGEEHVRKQWSSGDLATVDTFIAHARALRKAANPAALLQSWGGSTIVYRKGLQESPAHRINQEELAIALNEGIKFVENATPLAVEVDKEGRACGLRISVAGSEKILPAGTILVAAGTQPNTMLYREAKADAAMAACLEKGIEMNGRYFRAINEKGEAVEPAPTPKPAELHVLMAKHLDGRYISFFGDLHPSFAGSVVKALASAKQSVSCLSSVISHQSPVNSSLKTDDRRLTSESLTPTISAINRLTPTIVEVIVHAPAAARAFRPGQFFRLQNYEAYAPKIGGTTLAMEGLALTGAWADAEKSLVGLIVFESGGSSKICKLLKPGEPVVLMGPTGTPTKIPHNKTVCLVGGGLGNAVLFSIGQAARQNGCRVLYFAGYKNTRDRFKAEQIEAAADSIIWCCDEAPGFTPTRATDKSFVGNLVQAMQVYAKDLGEVDHFMVIGSDRMMAAVTQARHTTLKPYLKKGHTAMGSINSPMQCMMKEICAQCLQIQRDPVTREEKVVFSCAEQDQPLDAVDWKCLHDRLSQNSIGERLTDMWVESLLKPICDQHIET